MNSANVDSSHGGLQKRIFEVYFWRPTKALKQPHDKTWSLKGGALGRDPYFLSSSFPRGLSQWQTQMACWAVTCKEMCWYLFTLPRNKGLWTGYFFLLYTFLVGCFLLIFLKIMCTYIELLHFRSDIWCFCLVCRQPASLIQRKAPNLHSLAAGGVYPGSAVCLPAWTHQKKIK